MNGWLVERKLSMQPLAKEGQVLHLVQRASYFAYATLLL